MGVLVNMNSRHNPDDFTISALSQVIEHPQMQPDRRRSRAPIGQILVDMKALDPGDMLRAVALRAREDMPFGQILLAHGMVSENALMRALSVQFDCDVVDLRDQPPDPHLVSMVGFEQCLRLELLPWRMMGTYPVLLTARPERFLEDRAKLPPQFSQALMALAPAGEIARSIASIGRKHLSARAETRTAPELSSRDFSPRALGKAALMVLVVFVAFLLTVPTFTIAALSIFAAAILAVLTLLKFAALFAALTKPRPFTPLFHSSRSPNARDDLLPVVSLLIPLYRERSIAARLIRRLGRIDYPKELLDICLIVEEDDIMTRRALSNGALGPNMRVVTVPAGQLKTKPRALNFALDFARGSIIGVLDAEDAPAPDQVYKAVKRFHSAPADLACLQGILDFYNPGTNFLSRAFTLEYASWFRVMLPGLERLGLVVPLGGTTLYMRRSALEEMGGWDAHNVTEDADLGVRLSRMGYRTELFDSVTEEEANCRLWPWVKQRSRWLKGYAMTWAVHMRSPKRLWSELGPRRFFGFQALFLGTILHFLTLPLLVSFWAIPLGLPHPLANALPQIIWHGLVVTFITTEIATLAIAATGAARAGHKRLWPWIPFLHLYFPLAALAAYRAVWEMARNPFYWAKTEHGIAGRTKRRAQPHKTLGKFQIRPMLPRPVSGASRKPG